MTLNLIRSSLFVWLILPTLTFGQGFSLGVKNDTTFGTTIFYIKEIVDLTIPLLVTAAFIVFFWGLSKFILNSNKQTEIENGKTYMMWGVLALFILLSFRAIIGFIGGDLFGNGSTDPNSILLPTGASVRTGTAVQLPDGTFQIINE